LIHWAAQLNSPRGGAPAESNLRSLPRARPDCAPPSASFDSQSAVESAWRDETNAHHLRNSPSLRRGAATLADACDAVCVSDARRPLPCKTDIKNRPTNNTLDSELSWNLPLRFSGTSLRFTPPRFLLRPFSRLDYLTTSVRIWKLRRTDFGVNGFDLLSSHNPTFLSKV
jgi:hypothetical protein